METKSPHVAAPAGQSSVPQSIVILDFGAQYTQLIARRIREQNVFSVVLPCTAKLDEVKSYAPVGIVLSGAPWSVYDKDAPPADARIFQMGVPVLGICYGLQFMVHTLGGKVRPADKREYGHAEVDIVSDSILFQGLAKKLAVWMSHGDEALELPPGFELMAKTHYAVAGIQNTAKKWYAVQFHPEVHHTPQGTQMLKNFIFQICGAKPHGLPQRFIDSTVEQVKQQVGSGRAICALSGGVDSSVAAVLVDRALRDAKGKSRLTCIFVNNGVLRKNEFEKVQKALRDKLNLNLDAVDATDRFLGKLKGVSDPEKKRKIIGNEFIKVFEKEARRIEKTEGKVKWLVQGTLYPDVIESRSVRGPSQVIKSHHNVGGLPEKMKLKLIEPLKDLVQRRSPQDWPRSRHARRNSAAPALSRPGTRGARAGRSHARATGTAARVRRHCGQRGEECRPVYKNLAVVRCAAAGDVGRRDGRHADVCLHLRHPRRQFGRRHDG